MATRSPKKPKPGALDLQAELLRRAGIVRPDAEAAESAEFSELPGWQPLGTNIIGGSLGALVSATLSIAVGAVFLPSFSGDHTNPVVRAIIVFVVLTGGLCGGLWLAYSPISVDLGSKRIRWRGVEVGFEELGEFEIRTQAPYVLGRLTTRSGHRVRIVLHGEPTAGIGRSGRALLARVIEESSIKQVDVDPEGLSQDQLLVLNRATSRSRWRSLDVTEATFELTGVGEGRSGRPLIRSNVGAPVPGVTALRVVAFVLVVISPTVAFFTALFALLPPYFAREGSTIAFFVSLVAFTIGVWCFALARERLERIVLRRAGLPK